MRPKSGVIAACALALALVITMYIAPVMAGGDLPPAEGKAFWTYIHKTNPYTKWAMWPGKEGMLEGKSPHGKYVRIFVNRVALEAAKTGKPMPDGAIIIKENYKDTNALAVLTPMYKVKGYNPTAGDWYWTKIAANGKVLGEGKLKGCIRCHEAVKNTSWVFTK
jgi:hypothetical protein